MSDIYSTTPPALQSQRPKKHRSHRSHRRTDALPGPRRDCKVDFFFLHLAEAQDFSMKGLTTTSTFEPGHNAQTQTNDS